MNEDVKIKRKIFNLLQKAASNGCTEAEALSFADKAGTLMDQYSLSITDLQIMTTECITGEFAVKTAKTGHLGYIGMAVAKYCDCKPWVREGNRNGGIGTPGNGGKDDINPGHIVFFGLESDVQMVSYLLEIVSSSMEKGIIAFKKSDWWTDNVTCGDTNARDATKGFKVGFQHRIIQRFNEMKRDRDAVLARQQEEMEDALQAAEDNNWGEEAIPERRERTARNLVAVKKNRVEDEFKKIGMRLTTGSRSYTSNGDSSARGEGSNAASRVGLNSGVSGSNQTLAIT